MKTVKIGLIKETKIPVDNRVALNPEQIKKLNTKYPLHKIVVQSSDIRAFSDDEYREAGVEVVNDVADCDILFGIKEANLESLIPNKQYYFFGHFAKMQEYNLPLLQTIIRDKITFFDYEYLVDESGKRVCAFGWWAGAVGVYYTLRGYGLKYHTFELPKPDLKFTLAELLDNLKKIDLPCVKVLVTGDGRVSQGAQYVLNNIGACKLADKEYLSKTTVDELSYCVVKADKLVKRKDGAPFNRSDFEMNAQGYESDFNKWAKSTDVLICAHFWAPNAPVYLSEDDLRREDLRIRMIGDVTCDIKGSIKSTVKPATHSDPYYDYNPFSEQAEPAFSSEHNLTVMAVDTCPNALATDTSTYFGEMLIKHVFEPLLEGKESKIIEGAKIVEKGILTDKFAYLNDFALGID